MASSDVHHEVDSRLRSQGARYTEGRRALVELLAATDRPVTLPELLEDGDSLAQSSAYRNLAVLEQAGVIDRVVTNDEYARYELAEEITGRHHHHLVCEVCGEVTDFRLPDRVEDEVDRALARIARRAGFAAEQHRVDIVGRCARCAV